MYNVLLRDVKTGSKDWFTHCTINGKFKINKVIYWSPEKGGIKRKMKVIAWKWMGYEPKPECKRFAEVYKFSTDLLLGLDLPQEWRDELNQVDEDARQLKFLMAKYAIESQ